MRRQKVAVQQKKHEVLRQLSLLCNSVEEMSGATGEVPDPRMWPKTRELANNCGETIYTTRNILLQLVNEGKVIKHPSLLMNSLRWYINKQSGV